MKVLYGVLNWKRFDKQMAKSLSKIQNEDIVICTDDKTRWNQNLYKFIDADESLAISKNNILKYALDNGYTHCVIIEDDVFIVDKTVFLEYMHQMEKFDLNIMMYGYHGKANKVLDNRVNPCLLITIKNETPICINRFPTSEVIIYRIFEDMTYFDERLHSLEHDFIMRDMIDQNNYDFSGFIFDIHNSWKKFKRIPLKRIKKVDPKTIIHDKELRNVKEMNMSTNGDEVIHYIVEKLKG